MSETVSANNVKDAREDFRRVRGENKKYLEHLFSNTGPYVSNANKEIRKLFPGSGEKEGGGQLLKVARFSYQFAMRETPLIKEAAPHFHEVMFLGFCKELEKIAMLPGKTAGIPGQTLGQLRNKNAIGQMHNKVWNVSEGAAATRAAGQLSPGVQAMRSAAAAKAANPGILSRVGRGVAGIFGR